MTSLKRFSSTISLGFQGRRLYNLGFGNYDFSSGGIQDGTNPNNGDAYALFNTVLNTIPDFFRVFPDATLMVRGSHSGVEFEATCRRSCERNCGSRCRKQNRRIHVYCEYVNRNFKILVRDYFLYGAPELDELSALEVYDPRKEYNVVFLRKR